MLVFLIIGFLYNLRRIADFMGGTGVYDIDNNLDRTLFGEEKSAFRSQEPEWIQSME
jgi:hypothetical protein